MQFVFYNNDKKKNSSNKMVVGFHKLRDRDCLLDQLMEAVSAGRQTRPQIFQREREGEYIKADLLLWWFKRLGGWVEEFSLTLLHMLQLFMGDRKDNVSSADRAVRKADMVIFLSFKTETDVLTSFSSSFFSIIFFPGE